MRDTTSIVRIVESQQGDLLICPSHYSRFRPKASFCQHLRVQILEQCYPRDLVGELLTSCHAWEQRERKLTQLVIVYSIMALSLLRQCNVTEVFAHLSRGLRWLWSDDRMALPTGGALVARRPRLGIIVRRPLVRQWCRPLAREATTGAFALGWRLMAVDGTRDEVPETSANALPCGRLTTGKSPSPFPQVRCLDLAEVGTHAIVNAVRARARSRDHTLAQVLLRSIQQGMVVMTDRHACLGQVAHRVCRNVCWPMCATPRPSCRLVACASVRASSNGPFPPFVASNAGIFPSPGKTLPFRTFFFFEWH